jgi:hypothetical protein
LRLAIACINDEIFYYALKVFTDEAYMSKVSYLGATLLSFLEIAVLMTVPHL